MNTAYERPRAEGSGNLEEETWSGLDITAWKTHSLEY